MLRIAICDDEAEARDALRFLLENILYEGEEKIVYEFTAGKNAAGWLRNHPGEIDLLFLDVEMNGKNGMETAKEIREFNSELQIVFVTGFTDYVFDGYQVGALDYVIKPVKKERLIQVIERVRTLEKKQKDQVFCLKNQDGTYRFSYRKIDFFYSDKRIVTLVTEGKEYPFYGKLDEVEEQLKDKFVRIHQRYLVNPWKVDYIEKEQVCIGENRLPVSRGMKKDALSRIAHAMLEGGF